MGKFVVQKVTHRRWVSRKWRGWFLKFSLPPVPSSGFIPGD